jgi:hypothetical protein
VTPPSSADQRVHINFVPQPTKPEPGCEAPKADPSSAAPPAPVPAPGAEPAPKS